MYADEVNLKYLLDGWKRWDVQFVCLATLLSQILERKQKQSADPASILENIYRLPEERGLGLIVEELDERFIAYMFRFVRREDIAIDDDLIDIRHQLSEYKYP